MCINLSLVIGSVNNYQAFVDQLNEHINARDLMSPESWLAKSSLFVDGQAAGELRRLVDIDTRRAYGAFFTDSDLAYDVIVKSGIILGENAVIHDPAVGAGNLLLAVWKFIQSKNASIKLTGTDIHSQFIQAARLRLQIQDAINNGVAQIKHDLSINDGLSNNDYYAKATHILTNPPFNLMEVDETITWSKGKASAAAVFLEKIINYINPGTQVVAILPDVLRSGSRYKKWRSLIERYCIISNLRKLGQFDRYADVDVFAVTLKKRTQPISISGPYAWSECYKHGHILKDHFDISVGSVVDNRDKQIGPNRPFLVSRGLSGWQTITSATRQRQFSGRSIEGPFVVIKRTSRMGDKHRAVGSIINISEPVYVDNHLLIARPKSGNIEDCHRLIHLLATDKVNDWINEEIRCRHLTVKVVERIPYNA
jgi:N-6 DNA methylase